jgi:hypothetical protein
MSIFDVEDGAGTRTLKVRVPAFGEPVRAGREIGCCTELDGADGFIHSA